MKTRCHTQANARDVDGLVAWRADIDGSCAVLLRRFVVIRTGSFLGLFDIFDSFDSKSSFQENDSFDSIDVTDWRRTYREVEVRIPMTSPVAGRPHLESFSPTKSNKKALRTFILGLHVELLDCSFLLFLATYFIIKYIRTIDTYCAGSLNLTCNPLSHSPRPKKKYTVQSKDEILYFRLVGSHSPLFVFPVGECFLVASETCFFLFFYY
jgi:hypothetical protein